MKKKLFMILLSMMLVFSLVACSGKESQVNNEGSQSNESAAKDQPKFNYIMGHGAAEGSIGDLYSLKFKELIEAKSNGNITVDVYAGSQLGTYGEMLQSLQKGDIGGMIFQPAPAVSFIPELAMLDLPYAFYGYTQEEIDKTLNDSEFSKILDESFDKAGYKRMSFAQAATFREVTSSKKISSVEDFNGLKLRVLENKYHLEFWKNVGANPTPLPFGELYLSLQQGLVDAQENPYDTAYAAKFAEVQKYVVNTHHIIYPNLFIVNKDLYESMPAEYQKMFDEVAVEAKDFAQNLMKESSVKDLKNLQDAGLEVINFSDEELSKMKEKASVVEDLLRNDLGDQVVDTFFKSLDDSKN